MLKKDKNIRTAFKMLEGEHSEKQSNGLRTFLKSTLEVKWTVHEICNTPHFS